MKVDRKKNQDYRQGHEEKGLMFSLLDGRATFVLH